MDEKAIAKLVESCFVKDENREIGWDTSNDVVKAFNAMNGEFSKTYIYGDLFFGHPKTVNPKSLAVHLDGIIESVEALKASLLKAKSESNAPRGLVFSFDAATKAVDKFFDLLYKELSGQSGFPLSDGNRVALYGNANRIMNMCFEGKQESDVTKQDVLSCLNCVDSYLRAMIPVKQTNVKVEK